MRYWLVILGIIIITSSDAWGQDRGGRGAFSLSSMNKPRADVPDSVLMADSAALKGSRLKAYRLTPLIGDAYLAPLDTGKLNYGSSTLVEAQSVAMGYTSNIGNPGQSKIFSERKEARDFMFADAYDYYITTPENAYYYDTKLPYTNIMFNQGGSSENREDHLKGVLTWNFGKRVNVGGEMDYIYARGQYNSNGNKLLSYRIFGSYKADRYEMHAYAGNFNFVNYENGGLTNDDMLRNPDQYDSNVPGFNSKDYTTRLSDTWNRVRGKRWFLSHRYNLGYYKEINDTTDVFVPVSSFIHTLDYSDNRRHFLSHMPGIDTCYINDGGTLDNGKKLQYVYGLGSELDDRMSAWNLKNTFALSLREGFQDWVKFGLTAYVTFEKRKFKLPSRIPGVEYGSGNGSADSWTYGSGPAPEPENWNFAFSDIYDEFSTYLGAEFSKKRGTLLTYNVRGELCLVGDDVGEFRAEGELQTKFPLFGKEASIKANGYIRNTTPSFFYRHNHSRYFWWDMDLSKIQQFYAGGEVHLESTGTTVSAGVESIQNYVYFNTDGRPEQHGSNIQVVSARLKQDLHYKAFGWENEAVYQMSSNKDVLPLPEFSAYSNIYVHFKLAKVLTMQIGADVHYHTNYKAPYYEPATQQFQLQKEVTVGNYPLINGYVNFHLKQARFFIMGYNLGSMFIDPDYFSLAHYPLNPSLLKMGISVVFNN